MIDNPTTALDFIEKASNALNNVRAHLYDAWDTPDYIVYETWLKDTITLAAELHNRIDNFLMPERD